MSRATAIVQKLLEAEGEVPSADEFDAKAYFMSMAQPGDEPEVLNRFKNAIRLYIKWIDKPQPEHGYLANHGPHLRALRKAKTFDEAEAILALYDGEPSFLYMVGQGYFV